MSNEVTSAPSICMVLSAVTLALLRRAAEFVPVACFRKMMMNRFIRSVL